MEEKQGWYHSTEVTCENAGDCKCSSWTPLSFLKFYHSMVDFLCFRCIANWFSYACIHSFSDYFLIQVITEYWVEFPVLYLLVIYLIYNSVCTKIQAPDLSLPLHFGNLVVYVCGFICFVNKFLCIFYLESTYKWYDVCLSLSDLLHLVW